MTDLSYRSSLFSKIIKVIPSLIGREDDLWFALHGATEKQLDLMYRLWKEKEFNQLEEVVKGLL